MSGIENWIYRSEDIDLSASDILRMVNGQTNIIKYEELKNYYSLEQLFNPYGCFVLLYQTKENYGHWVVLIDRGNKNLEFYDPYGLRPDEELNISNDFHLRIHGGQITPHLTSLIKKDGWKVKYNDKKLQKFLEHTNTCGRYIVLRILYKNTSIQTFNNFLQKNKHYDADFWVSALTFLL